MKSRRVLGLTLNLRLLWLLCMSFTSIGFSLSGEIAVYAQRSPQEAASQVSGLLRSAYQYYDNLEMELMDEALGQVLDIAVRFPPHTQSMARNVAEACVLKGLIVFVNQSSNHTEIKRHFTQALQYDPNIKLNPSISTPQLERLFNETRSQFTPPAQNPNPYNPPPPQNPNPYNPPPQNPNPYNPPPQNPNPYNPPPQNPNPYNPPSQNPYPPANPAPVSDLMHVPMANATAGRPFPIRVQVSQNLKPQTFWVRLFYQTQGTIGTQRLDLQAVSPLEFAGEIPSQFMTGSQLLYYIIVYDQAENQIYGYKNSSNPQVVNILGNPYANDLNPTKPKANDAYVAVNLMLGTGGGLLSGPVFLQKQQRRETINGIAWAPFHVQLELDFWLGQSIALGLFSRLQIVEFALLGGAQLKWFLTNTADSRFALRVGGGYGEARHLVSVQYRNSMNQIRQGLDTALQGPIFYKLGAEYSTALSDILSFIVATDFTHLITPDPTSENSPAKHFDLHLGLSISF